MDNEAQEKIEYVNEEPVSPSLDLSDGSQGGQEAAEQKIKKLRTFLKRCKKVRAEYLDGWQRARAEFQNYAKQADSQMQDFKKFAAEDVILQALPVLENLTLACESIPKNIAEDNWVKGIVQIRKYLAGVFRENGVEEIAARPGDAFNPVYHEAAEETESGGKSGTISEVLQRGYTLHGRVIKVARVKVIQ